MRTSRGLLAMVVMLTLAGHARTDDVAELSPVDRPTIALLEPEHITADAQAADHHLVAWLDAVLSASLAAQADLAAVDRQQLEALLNEHALQAANQGQVEAALRPFIASGVLVCPVIVVDAESGEAIVTVQAVLAQRRDLWAELVVTGEWTDGDWRVEPELDEPLTRFWGELRDVLEARQGVPTLEVQRFALAEAGDRLQWLADEVADGLMAMPWDGMVLLRPRQAVHTKEERLLRVMGLSEPAAGDGSAMFRSTSDYQIAGELVEHGDPDVPFDQTPVTLTLRLTVGKQVLAEGELAGEAGQAAALHEQAQVWAADAIAAHVGDGVVVTEAEEHLRASAEREFATARRLVAISYGPGAMERSRQMRLAEAALGAAHLDPTDEEAAYLVVMSIEGLYAARGQRNTLAAQERVIRLGEQYLDRFGDLVAEHHRDVLRRIGSAGLRAARRVGGRPSEIEAIAREPDARQYPYVRAYVRVWMEGGIRAATDRRYHTSNALQATPRHLLMHLIPNTPDEKLDEEYAYWRGLWQDRVEPLQKADVLPWALIDMAFHARRRESETVRTRLQALAEQYPSTRSDIWRRGREDTVSLYLRAAGDSEWRTWRPHFAHKPALPQVEHHVVRRFAQRLRPPFLSIWDYDNALPAPGVWVQFPESVREVGRTNRVVPYPRVEFMLTAGDTAWFAAPHLYDYLNNRPHHLLTVPLNRIVGHGDSVTLGEQDVTEIEWPDLDGEKVDRPRIGSWAVTGDADSSTVWLGTREAGLARFDRRDEAWVGRWYGAAEGLPMEIVHLATYQGEDEPRLLVVGLGPDVRNAPQEVLLLSIDLEADAVRLLTREQVPGAWSGPRATCVPRVLAWADGQRVPLSVFGDPYFPNLNADAAEGMAAWETGLSRPRPAVTRHDQPPHVRLWAIPSAPAAGSFLRELNMQTLRPRPTPLGEGPQQRGDRDDFLWPTMRRNQPGPNPVDKVGQGVGIGGEVWLTMSPSGGVQSQGEGDAIMIYRPAPHDEPDWARHDRWFGPFRSPDGGQFFSLIADGQHRLWATAVQGVLLMEPAEVMAAAERAGHAMSTAAWREAYTEQLAAAPWRQRARAMLADEQFDELIALLDALAASLPKTVDHDADRARRDDWTDMMLYRAMALAHMGRHDEALERLDTLWTDGALAPEARREAAIMRIRTFAAAGRWQAVLDAIKHLEGGLDDRPGARWASLIKQARRERTSEAAVK